MQALEYVFTFNPRIWRRKGLLNCLSKKDRERIVKANTKIPGIWAEIRVMLFDPDGMIIRTKKAQKKQPESFLQKMRAFDSLGLAEARD